MKDTLTKWRMNMGGILLLIIIYLSFISLGLPDTVMGVAWPSMRLFLGLPLEAGGIFSMVATIGTVTSGFMSGWVLRRVGTGKVVLISCIMTGLALLGYGFAPNFWWLLLLTIPLGLGGGSVDAGLNHYVATYYSARHMNWLHSFWGVGAFIGPNIMTLMIVYLGGYQAGYRLIGGIQLVIALFIFMSLPLWTRNKAPRVVTEENANHEEAKGWALIKKPGVFLAILVFPIYVGAEFGVGYWLGSYLIEYKMIPQLTAGVMVATFFGGIAVGRFLNGIASEKFSGKVLIRFGLLLLSIGVIFMMFSGPLLLKGAIILMGLGCAPIYPAVVHMTPGWFGMENSKSIIGYQVGSSYLSGLLLIPLVGALSSWIGLWIYPVLIAVLVGILIIITERLHRIMA